MASNLMYREVIRPPLWLASFIFFMLFSLDIAIWAAFNNSIALNAFLISIAIGAVALFNMRTIITVSEQELRINRAHIPLRCLGESTAIAKRDFSFERTRGADPAAYFATTFWLSEGIKVRVDDQRDPTPYWLISTKRSEALIAALKN